MYIAYEFLNLFKRFKVRNILVCPQIGLEIPERLNICPSCRKNEEKRVKVSKKQARVETFF